VGFVAVKSLQFQTSQCLLKLRRSGINALCISNDAPPTEISIFVGNDASMNIRLPKTVWGTRNTGIILSGTTVCGAASVAARRAISPFHGVLSFKVPVLSGRHAQGVLWRLG
jgi:hypothetical protein